MQVTVYPSTAIASSVYIAKGTDSKGKPMDVRQQYTDTWVKMPDGKWQVVASHGSDIKK
jgi:ketosteroid isomerase-like protein